MPAYIVEITEISEERLTVEVDAFTEQGAIDMARANVYAGKYDDRKRDWCGVLDRKFVAGRLV